MAFRNREEVINTQLALLISTLGVRADAETIHVHGRHRPDVLFQLRGLRVVIEGKFADSPNAEEVALGDARDRVRAGIAHIAAAAVYPLRLRSTPTTKVLEVLSSSQLRYRIVAETLESEWFEGTPAALMDALRRAQEALTKDDIIEKIAQSLSTHLDAVAQLWTGQPGACDRLSRLLGISFPKTEPGDKAAERRETAAKVSALVLANAFIFQEQLAGSDGRITSLRRLTSEKDIVAVVGRHWKWIWENINYVPIFQLGERILQELPISSNSSLAVRSLLSEAQAICVQQGALRHDLMGRIYHWLLHYAKYLGTYYTAVSSATLLMKLVMAAKWKQDFGDPATLVSFKVADLACGTGTLLMASAQALSDSYIRRRADTGRTLNAVDLQTLHRALMENVLHGYDVLPSAVHLTASTLALLAPEVAFVRMNLFVMPLGMDGKAPRLGSIDFLDANEAQTQFQLDYSHIETLRTGASGTAVVNASVPPLQLCVMNPPFTRSVGHNLLFGSLPDERGVLQKELKRRARDIPANISAGLGSVFTVTAHRHLEAGGRLAFVLPAALASGESWGPTRALIASAYHLETVVSSQDEARPNFSENTALSELLFIARKLEPNEVAGATRFVNLWRNPRSIYEALDVANRVEDAQSVVAVDGEGVTELRARDAKLGEMVTTPAPRGSDNWTGALFAQTELLRSAWFLEREARLRVPGHAPSSLPMCRLDALGAVGPDRKRIHEGFTVSVDDWSPYPGFWGHDSNAVLSIQQKPNAWLHVWKDSPRGPHYGEHLWERAGRILLVERLWTITHRVLAIGFDEPILGNTWWSFKPDGIDERQIKALLLYLNSSPALLLYFGRRVVTRSAWMMMKQPAWESMPVLDVRSLPDGTITHMADAYDRLSLRPLEALSRLNTDPARREVDEALSAAVALPDLNAIRQLLAREPGLSVQHLGHDGRQASLELGEGEDSQPDEEQQHTLVFSETAAHQVPASPTRGRKSFRSKRR